jgi:hypothetical protein
MAAKKRAKKSSKKKSKKSEAKRIHPAGFKVKGKSVKKPSGKKRNLGHGGVIPLDVLEKRSGRLNRLILKRGGQPQS